MMFVIGAHSLVLALWIHQKSGYTLIWECRTLITRQTGLLFLHHFKNMSVHFLAASHKYTV